MSEDIFKIISNYIGFNKTELLKLGEKAPYTYRRYLIAKKKGGEREKSFIHRKQLKQFNMQ